MEPGAVREEVNNPQFVEMIEIAEGAGAMTIGSVTLSVEIVVDNVGRWTNDVVNCDCVICACVCVSVRDKTVFGFMVLTEIDLKF